MNPAIAARIPLVCRPKPPGLPLDKRIAELTALTAETPGADHSKRVARACGVLNFSALIASDSGMPDLAAELCRRQHKVFAEAESLNQDIAVMSLVNIARGWARDSAVPFKKQAARPAPSCLPHPKDRGQGCVPG
ncbi:hypothetical protein ACFY3V_27800 [Streptosporangium sp. NPDC000095]|uniref:hypothetical protein n=1 Tax=Streptosporangium sp. NPDC000095 TaxID=3366184 RepID=UPI0036AC359C